MLLYKMFFVEGAPWAVPLDERTSQGARRSTELSVGELSDQLLFIAQCLLQNEPAGPTLVDTARSRTASKTSKLASQRVFAITQ